METFPDLFVSTVPKPPARWLLATNQRNLLYMLAAGLVMPPQGFGQKYYLDSLDHYPGWIPVFADSAPKAVLEYAVSERRGLTPCLATLSLDPLRGKVLGVTREGRTREIQFPEGLDGSEAALLIPAPLPIHWITAILFPSREDKAACEADAQDFGNVPLLDFKRETQPQAFAKAPDWPWPPVPGPELPALSLDLGMPFAAGAMMAMLFQLGNTGDTALAAFRMAFDPEGRCDSPPSDPLIQPLAEWMRTGRCQHGGDVSRMLFWGAVERVAASRFSGEGGTALDVVLAYLEAAGADLDERMRSALAKLTGDLRTIAGFAESTITEIFERHPKTFSRVMAMFFLRERCAELLEFKHPLLTESDDVAAALLFAAREGWLGLPLTLRGCHGAQAAITQRMAALAHRIGGTGLDLGIPLPRPLSLRELFEPGAKGWSKSQKEAALVLAREQKWDCIQTRISLGKGEYRMEVNGTGLHILVEGEAKAVVSEVDGVRFFRELAQIHIADKLDRKVREILRKE
jgi:hypothetical protein